MDSMTAGRDRAVASLLSALAEAPDFQAAISLFLTQLTEMTGATRAVMLRFDSSRESLTIVSAIGADTANGNLRPGDCVTAPFGDPWVPLALSEPRHDSAPAPTGVILLHGPIEDPALEDATDLLKLASPIVARLMSLHDALLTAERLAQQRDRLTLMVDSLPDPVVITTGGGEIIAQNDRADRLLHPRDDDTIERRRTLVQNNLLFTSFLAQEAAGTAQHGAEDRERELILADPDHGHDLLFEVLTHPLGQRVGPDDAVLSVLRDVTDLRRAAKELERQVQRVRQAEVTVRGERDRLNLVLENVADPILVTDGRSNIILMNDQAEQLFYFVELDGRSRRELAAVARNNTKVMSFISEFASRGEDARREQMSLVHPGNGVELPVEVVSGKVKDERGEPIAIVSVLHDLTRQVENERLYEALKRLNSELEGRIREATADLAEQNARLQWQSQEVERANRLKSEFLASMSHELRTPINALIGYSALLIDGVLGDVNPKQQDALTRGRAAAEHLLALINDILDLARIEAGKMPLHVQGVVVRDVILEVTSQVEPMVRKKQLDFTIDVESDCPDIFSDRTKIKQVLLNLLSNAVKFTSQGRVSITGRREEGGVRIDVVDTGIGIRPTDLQAIWEDFRQVDQSRTREFGGTGLGLSITRKLLERLGGSVTVESTYGSGSTFSVVLPLTIPVGALSDLTSEGYGE
jgi:PAS domain S-box-containing protein